MASSREDLGLGGDDQILTLLLHPLPLPPLSQLTVIQGDISELTVDAVVHPTNATFNLGGQCGTFGPSFLVLVSH